MIYVDNRMGSKDLYPLLKGRGLPVTLTRMDYGDVSWLGEGPDGAPVSVGVEVKTIHDVVKCIADGRFAGVQLPGLVKSYDQVWLLIEGRTRCHERSGQLEYLHLSRSKGKPEWRPVTAGTRLFQWRDLTTWLLTMQTKGGVNVIQLSDWGQVIVWLSTAYRWWTEGWESHKSHLAFHDGTRNGTPFKRDRATRMVAGLADRALLVKPSLCRMVAAQLPSIGWEKSKHIADRYRTVEELCAATVEELQELPGIGPKLAVGIHESLRSTR
jgi:ERCC4-type nuclease